MVELFVSDAVIQDIIIVKRVVTRLRLSACSIIVEQDGICLPHEVLALCLLIASCSPASSQS